MSILPKSIRKLIEEFSKLPGIGPKTASRLTFFLLKSQDLDRENLSKAVGGLKTELMFCQQCHNLAESLLCAICSDQNRHQNLICVVEEPLDVVALEQGRRFAGVYHVLGGVISPIDGVGPDDLKIRELIERVMGLDPSLQLSPGDLSAMSSSFDPEGSQTLNGRPNEGRGRPYPAGERSPKVEIVIATNPSLEGEGTAMYLAKKLRQIPGVKITRIAHGLPIGGDLEYADELTISKAMEGRRDYQVN